MIEEAEIYQVQDEEKQSSLKQKEELETYLYSVTKVLKKSDVKKNMPREMIDELLDEVESILEWCEDNPEEKAEVYEKKLHDFELKAELKIAPFRVFDGISIFLFLIFQWILNHIWNQIMVLLQINQISLFV